jgi:hypothetical protein
MDEEARLVAITDALRRVAPDQLHLADSVSFGKRLNGVSPATLGFDAQVRQVVRDHVGPSPAEAAAEQAAKAERERAAREADSRFRRAHGQWTQADVDACEDPQELRDAYHAGRLAGVGMPAPPRPVPRRQVAAPVAPSMAQVRRWRSMPPWQAHRERARWAAQFEGGGDAA